MSKPRNHLLFEATIKTMGEIATLEASKDITDEQKRTLAIKKHRLERYKHRINKISHDYDILRDWFKSEYMSASDKPNDTQTEQKDVVNNDILISIKTDIRKTKEIIESMIFIYFLYLCYSAVMMII